MAKRSLTLNFRHRNACIRWLSERESSWKREHEQRWRAEFQESTEMRQSGWFDFNLQPPPRDLYVEMRRACSWHEVRRASDLSPYENTQNLFWRALQHTIHSRIAYEAFDAPPSNQDVSMIL